MFKDIKTCTIIKWHDKNLGIWVCNELNQFWMVLTTSHPTNKVKLVNIF